MSRRMVNPVRARLIQPLIPRHPQPRNLDRPKSNAQASKVAKN